MKKSLIVLLAALLWLCAGAALAVEPAEVDGYPIDPYRMQANALSLMDIRGGDRVFLAAGLSVSLSEPTGDYFESGMTWTATASGGDGNYEYQFQLIALDDPFPNRRVHGHQPYSASDAFSYLFMVPGSYSLRCWVRDGSGDVAAAVSNFEVVDDARPTTAQLVSRIVAECREAGVTGDYETALWLHDWITGHACYDYSYAYYSADGVLLRGTGVCDSYCKAYQLLLEEAGIWADCVTSSVHAWNIALLDGKYYQIDPTWDDPSRITEPVSGNEMHLYFGLTDALMTLDHGYTPAADRPCDSYDCNYFIRSGKVDDWIDQPGANRDASGVNRLAERALSDEVAEGLSAYRLRYQLAIPDYYMLDSGSFSSGKERIVYTLCAYAMSGRDWPLDGESLRLDVEYAHADRALTVRVILNDTLLALPAGLLDVEAESFMGDGGFMAVEIPEGARSIGARAFARCENLWKVVVPDSVTEIAPDAFEDSPRVNLVCSAGSAAADFAEANGVNRVDP